MIDGESEKEIKLRQSNQGDQEIEIDLMDILRKIIGIRKKIYKAAGIDNWYYYSNKYSKAIYS